MVHAALLQTLAIAIITPDNHVYKSTGSTFTEYPGGRLAKDIAMTRTGKPWIIDPATKSIFFHDGTDWVLVPQGLIERIAVDACGTPWALGTTWKVYKWTGFNWYQIPGTNTGIDLSVDGNDRVWIVGSDKGVWYNVAGTYQRYGSSTAKKIALSMDGTPYIIGTDDRVKKGNGSDFTDLGISAIEIAVSSFGTVWVVDINGDPYFMKGGHWYKHLDGQKAIAIAAA